jgi:hypothetical protein
MVVALGPATASGSTLVGINEFGPSGTAGNLRYLPAREHTPGELVTHPRATVPEVRHTAAVLGMQPIGSWGVSHGCNEHGLTAGATNWRSRLGDGPRTLDGADLVRLTLERGRSAQHGLDLLTDLIERHGQTGESGDSVFLLADANESFVVEAAGNHWALLPCHQTRAVCDAGLIRQDWQRLSRGLGSLVLERNWWPADGTKLDFHASLGADRHERESLRRWSRATLALAQQEGALDPFCLRRLLSEHLDQCTDLAPSGAAWQGSWIANLVPGRSPLVWVAPAYLEQPLYFPLVVGVPLPQPWVEGLPTPRRRILRDDQATQAIYDRLQASFDQDVEAFLRDGSADAMLTAGQNWMNRHVELWTAEFGGVRSVVNPTRLRAEDMLAFITE